MNTKFLYSLAAAAMLLGKLFIPFGRGLAMEKKPEPDRLPNAPPSEKIPARRLNTSMPVLDK